MYLWSMSTDQDLIRRARRAYFRRFPNADQPSAGGRIDWAYVGDERRQYVVLENFARTLAVYRVGNDGDLRWLKRWPRDIDDEHAV